MAKVVLWAGVAISPTLVVMFLVHHYFHVGLLDFTPAWSDEIDYWHQVATFRAAGLAGGVYGIDEAQAKLDFLHFGSHGPAFPMLMASISAIAGWRPFSGPLINLAVIGTAIFGYLALIRGGWMKAAMTGTLLLTFWPLMLYLTSTMQESVHQALAIVLAAPLSQLIRHGRNTSRTLYVTALVLLSPACLLRPTWALLFVPLFFLRGGSLSSRRLAWAALKASPIIVAAFGLSIIASAPYPGFVSQLTKMAGRSPIGGIELLLQHFWVSAKGLARGNLLEVGLRAALLAIVGAAFFAVVRHFRNGTIADHRENLAAGAFHLLNLVPLLLLLLGLYDISAWRDYRVLAPNVLLSALVALAGSERVIMISTLAAQLALIGVVGSVFFRLHNPHFAPVDAKTIALGDHIMYTRGASPWENTVLVDFANYGPGLVNVPAGVGLTLHWPGSTHPVRSRYLLMTEDTARELSPGRLRLLTTTRQGNLYLRED